MRQEQAAPHRPPVAVSPPSNNTAVRARREECWTLTLTKVPSGVAAGKAVRSRGNIFIEWWALFPSQEQFHACSAGDPLRFTDPLLFARITKEFDHVFHHAGSRTIHSRTRDESGLHGPRAQRHRPHSSGKRPT
jgi:hypothetical protein